MVWIIPPKAWRPARRKMKKTWGFFGRFLAMLYLMKAFDIICFDWFLLTKSHFSSIFTQKQKDARATASLALIARSSLRELLYFRFLPRCLRGSVQFYNQSGGEAAYVQTGV